MSDSDLLRLYSDRLLALAADIPRLGRLERPQGTGRRRSPTCGSTVSVEVRVEEGRACALGQAAAAVVGAAAVGRTAGELRQGRDGLRAMLKAGAPPPPAPWSGFEALLPARDHPNRHASILLAIEAAIEAVEAAEGGAAAGAPSR
jgi:NifU-like protein involved in Fe-S cluster formation